MSKNNEVSKEQLLKAIENLENNPHDKLDILADIGIGAIGAGTAGAAVAAFGGTSILFGLVTIAPPLGLIAGGAMLGAGALVGLKKVLFDGSFNEGYQQKLLIDLRQQLKEVEANERARGIGENDKNKFIIFLKEPLKLNLITPEDAQKLIKAVENGQISLKDAIKYIEDVIKLKKV